MAAVSLFMKSTRLVVQDRPLMNPCWVLEIRPFFSRWATIFSLIRDSIILQGTEVRDTGL